MKKVAIIGSTGMLGSMVYNVLKEHCFVILTFRDKEKANLLEKYYGGTKYARLIQTDLASFSADLISHHRSKTKKLDKFVKQIGDVDYVINCAGIVNRYSDKDAYETLFLNAVIPHMLSNLYSSKLIQITTDCVFDKGNNAPYTENSLLCPSDWYSMSKSLGEPTKQSLILRTSVIGPEMGTHNLLLEWLCHQKKQAFGFTNHYWNGITTREFANICLKIIHSPSKYPKTGLFHIFSTDTSKYMLLKKIKQKYNLPIKIIPKKVEPLDRRLRTIYSLNKRLNIAHLDEMIANL